jgi:hypothetical protein
MNKNCADDLWRSSRGWKFSFTFTFLVDKVTNAEFSIIYIALFDKSQLEVKFLWIEITHECSEREVTMPQKTLLHGEH